ncbi:tetratricopeptide repeat protein [Geomobilimonas luticola]|uniref:Tetratricopeptide repeat protein n=1 Tax=Geomobilimonas luticola TaxID=1114878 RepID=A0ABS5S8Q7_9BACT|nr:hypothetical protein [Geomobilimonas luticola]MBT0651758.1 hypothetical protein [Geomobilimonas luticola]
MDKAKTIAVNVVVTAIIAIILIWGNSWYRQWSQFNRGEAALAKGDFVAAIAGYEAAIHMYTPGSPLVERTAEKLWGIAEEREENGDRQLALVAYRALRSSFYSTWGLTRPGTWWIARCDAKIAQLVKLQGEAGAQKS